MRDGIWNPPKRGVGDSTLRPLIDRSLARLRDETGVSLTFAGQVQNSALNLGFFDGHVVGPLRGALLGAGHGLGGQVLLRRRAMAVRNYLDAPFITHVYDKIIRAEGLRTFAAAPVVIGRQPIAVLYAAERSAVQEFGRTVDAVLDEARLLEQAMTVADTLHNLRSTENEQEERKRRARTLDVYRELREISGQVSDQALRIRLLDAIEQLSDGNTDDEFPIHLTPREQDVLALLSSGSPNRTIAERLGIGLHTVKGHVKSLLRKLDATTRFEAVVAARRHGLLP
jgi:prepilin-type processing-associated H-X9-DG protein